ncbi:hypothetical protein BC943DRAFT_166385 [Umbelopsis sp. AD052]|nr:hypothetical protein BC943DRAFT_166385 [Umbelopsis sp. AD052]
MSFQPTSPINISGSHHTRRHSSSIGSFSRLPVMSSSWNNIKGLSVSIYDLFLFSFIHIRYYYHQTTTTTTLDRIWIASDFGYNSDIMAYLLVVSLRLFSRLLSISICLVLVCQFLSACLLLLKKIDSPRIVSASCYWLSFQVISSFKFFTCIVSFSKNYFSLSAYLA